MAVKASVRLMAVLQRLKQVIGALRRFGFVGEYELVLAAVGLLSPMLAGAAMGMMSPYGRDPMKTQVGKSIRKLGIAVDNAVDNIVSDLR